MRAIREYDIVEIVRLRRELADYDGWRGNRRSPTVGEHGVVVDIHAHSDGQLVYVVETADQAEPDWLAEFSKDEIRPTGKRHKFHRVPLKHPLSITVCFVLASYAVFVTGTTLACAVWLPTFKVPPETPSFRPMGTSVMCLQIAALTTALSLGFAFAAVASNPRRPLVWVASVCLALLSLAPFPVSRAFAHWVFATQGLELAP